MSVIQRFIRWLKGLPVREIAARLSEIPLFAGIAGMILFPVVIFGPHLTELWGIEMHGVVDEIAAKVIPVSTYSGDPAHEGKLVHVTGMLSASDAVIVDSLGLATHALRLHRAVSMYQYDEICKEVTEQHTQEPSRTERTYRVERIWHDGIIDSSVFQASATHRNPKRCVPESWSTTAPAINLAGFSIEPAALAWALKDEPIALTELPPALSSGANPDHGMPVAEAPSPEALGTSLGDPARLYHGGIYLGNNPDTPAIGDRHIKYSVARPQAVSVIAMQSGGRLLAYRTSAEVPVLLLARGSLSATELVSMARGQVTRRVSDDRFKFFTIMSVCLFFILPWIPEKFFFQRLGEAARRSIPQRIVASCILSFGFLLISWVFCHFAVVSIILFVTGVRHAINSAENPATAVQSKAARRSRRDGLK